MDDVEVEGGRLAYRQQGAGEPVLLMHPGFVADGMLPLLDQPALAAFRLVLYHRRGYGRSSGAGGPVGMARLARDAVAVLDHLGIDRVHLVGHSLGADVALQTALDFPDRVASLALLEPLLGFALSLEAAAGVEATVRTALPRFAAGDAEGAVDAWLTSAFGPGYREALERALPGSWPAVVRDAATAFGSELPALQDWPLGPQDLARIDLPVLTLTHDGDPWPGFAETHAFLAARIPRCAAEVVDVPSHLLQLAAPAAVADALAAFLARYPTGSDRRAARTASRP
ncbi:alpha/beta fold hydrolase [Geodermatophilus sp. URMC 64]